MARITAGGREFLIRSVHSQPPLWRTRVRAQAVVDRFIEEKLGGLNLIDFSDFRKRTKPLDIVGGNVSDKAVQQIAKAILDSSHGTIYLPHISTAEERTYTPVGE